MNAIFKYTLGKYGTKTENYLHNMDTSVKLFYYYILNFETI